MAETETDRASAARLERAMTPELAAVAAGAGRLYELAAADGRLAAQRDAERELARRLAELGLEDALAATKLARQVLGRTPAVHVKDSTMNLLDAAAHELADRLREVAREAAR